MIQPATGAPNSDPIITIGGGSFSLRFSFIAQYEADRLRVNLVDFIAGLKTNNTGTLSSFVALFASMVAHNFTAIGQPVPTPEYWASMLDRETRDKRSEVFGRVADVLAAWLKEQAPAAVRLQESAPSAESGPTLN